MKLNENIARLNLMSTSELEDYIGKELPTVAPTLSSDLKVDLGKLLILGRNHGVKSGLLMHHGAHGMSGFEESTYFEEAKKYVSGLDLNPEQQALFYSVARYTFYMGSKNPKYEITPPIYETFLTHLA